MARRNYMRAAGRIYGTAKNLSKKYPRQSNWAINKAKKFMLPMVAGAGLRLASKFRLPSSLPSIGNNGNRQLFQGVRTSGAGATRSFVKRIVSRRRGFAKRVREVSTKQWYQNAKGYKMSQGYGKQQVLATEILSRTTLDAISNNVPNYNDNTTILVKDVLNKFLISNTATANVYVDIYDYSFRKNTNTPPYLLFRNGLVDSGMSNANYPAEETYGITPFKSPAFTTFIKINKVTRVELGAGRSHEHVTKLAMNKSFIRQEIAENSNEYHPGWTNGVLIITRGEPVHNGVWPAATASTVSTATQVLDIVQVSEISYFYALPSSSTIESVNTLSYTGFTTENVMNEVSGEPDTNQAA